KIAPVYSPAILRLADTYFKTGRLDKARVYYKRRLALLPGDPYALLGLARIALNKSEWTLAEDYLKRAIGSNPSFGDAHRLLASVYMHSSQISEAKKCLERADRCARFHPASDPWVNTLTDELCYGTEELLVLASKAVSELNIEKALNFFNRAMEVDPQNPKVQIALAKAYWMLGRTNLAQKFFKNTLQLDPRNDEAHFYLGLILRKEKDFVGAEKMFLKALKFQSSNANVYNNLGVVYLEEHKYKKAIHCFRQALNIYPEHLEALYNLGLAFWASGHKEAALKQYYQVLQVKPNWPKAANSLAWILATDKDKNIRNGKEAIKWALVACKGEGRQNPEYLDTLAAAYAEEGFFDKAVETAERCLRLAKSSRNADLAKEVSQRLRLYRSNKPFHK
ncbi:MAG: tetratricopeptide repeat protein, partial [Deltaproteobacteria bacterium]|nr:tetratricopeptide repeat protein [Deltaproteobacteria bacterium]